MRCTASSLTAIALSTLFVATSGHSQTMEDARLASAEAIVYAFTTDPTTAIPPLLLQSARGIAIIPDVIRGGFIFGARRGRGVVMVRSDDGRWSNPSFVTLTGGSVGAQIGADSTDIVFVFASERSVRDIAEGKFTVGGDAAATAGPIGRNSTATRDMTFTAEIYTYVRSSGLFAGATIDGSRINIDHDANASMYPTGGTAQPLGPVTSETPENARRLLTRLENAEASAPLPPESRPPASRSSQEQQQEAVTYPLGSGGN
ncbi:MAG TPA: lipid-binding SYLF domain-containing protein [Gammaproteobacteria bacterium]